MSIVISKATLHDVEQLAVLFDAYRMFYKQDSDIKGAVQFLKERIQLQQSEIYIATIQSKMVGFVQLYPIFSSVGMKRTWLLNDLYVDENARGKGIANMLLQSAQKFGRQTQSRWLMLQTATDNLAAQKVYERNGWIKDTEFFTYQFYY